MARDKIQTEQRIKSALTERDTRVAVLISGGVKASLDMIDEQSPAVLEAMLNIGKEKLRDKGYLLHRRGLAAEYMRYLEQALKQATAREHRLLHGITGEESPDS
jgi:serine/threonine protein kinase HipA of HipAB toxin-antitoxin module